MHLRFTEYAENLETMELPPLPYTYKEVEHLMVTEMLDLHYTKLHQGYVDRYNAARKKSGQKVLHLPASTKEDKTLLFNLGGAINHTFFWNAFSPKNEDHSMSSELNELFNETFKSKEEFEKAVLDVIPSIQGSGWIWLLYCPESRKMYLDYTMNQDFPTKGVPLLNIDLWEHAYYIQYKVDKVTYTKSMIAALNWRSASDIFRRANEKGT
ncbi:superoxide dismutase, Fe-Mn family [Nematocida sp. LUAm3]|nr:superoxide dismutase, Fe-Mn family [Nematocida sp. LUAm3]KAI5174116.1 superoxide dismutase, Fe-Mn family [Nematocida sp. LUAm2]KAI5177141.1 superoxide dismutase, Fe-Mn family [Nematocida sp. LUAm1]